MDAAFMFASKKCGLARNVSANYSYAMTLSRALIALAILPIASCASGTNAPTKDLGALSLPGGYVLVWSDEFETDGLPDTSKWAYDTYRNKDGWWNEELQYYSDARSKNSRVEDGNLIIEAHAETLDPTNFKDWGDQTYTSARLFTKGKAAWQYGYMEIRAKLPCGRGLWPAIWTLPEDGGQWPDSGEIDIMEYVGQKKNIFHATVHTKKYNHTNGSQFGAESVSATACGDYHTHSLHWTEDRITVAMDGKTYFTYENMGEGQDAWPFDRPHHLILNVAVGGWGGQEGIDADAFPARMHVDYVRVYQNTAADRQ
jgi:beta-glucanase (GH16 family)